LAQPKTKELVEALTRWGVQPQQKVLLVLTEIPEAIYLSARNIPYINLTRADSINVYDVLVADVIVATSEALATIQEIYHD
jgi:large subunit ribosomal protein L4